MESLHLRVLEDARAWRLAGYAVTLAASSPKGSARADDIAGANASDGSEAHGMATAASCVTG
jgi:hypothetical protein